MIELNGGKVAGSLTVHIGLDLCPIWAQIALDHARRAQGLRGRVMAAWQGTDDSVLGDALIAEFTTSMQCIVAAGVAVDALYAAIKDRTSVPESLLDTCQRNRTARYKQVGEVLRRAFHVSPRYAVGIRAAIREIYKYRDWAVHPPAQASAPARHPALGLNTEWRFVAFSYPNAWHLTRAAISLAWQAANRTDVPKDLHDYCQSLRSLLAPVVSEWEASFGSLSAPTVEVPGGAA